MLNYTRKVVECNKKGRGIMTKSARIQENITRFLADGYPHTVQEIKAFLQQVGVSDYSEGQFSGSINTMLRNKSIEIFYCAILSFYLIIIKKKIQRRH